MVVLVCLSRVYGAGICCADMGKRGGVVDGSQGGGLGCQFVEPEVHFVGCVKLAEMLE